MHYLDTEHPVALALTAAIQTGNVETLQSMLTKNPELAQAKIREQDGSAARSLLHIATDWPGHFPKVAETIEVLVAAGADVNARFEGFHTETPLHWSASSDDVEALDALLDLGADMEAKGAVIAEGTPLTDARAFKQWKAAFRLVERGAEVSLVDAATLGLMDQVSAFFNGSVQPDQENINVAFWGACHGGRHEAAEYLLEKGAEMNWVANWEPVTGLDTAERNGSLELVQWLRERGGKSASE